MVVGAEGNELFVGSLVAVTQLTGCWRILTMGETVIIISQDRSAPYRRNIDLDDVTEQFAQRLSVHAPHMMISPRTWSEKPVGPNMRVEHAGFPTRASRIPAREMASAICAKDCLELKNDDGILRIAANTIDAYMAKTVMKRAHTRLLQVAYRLTTGEFGSIALVAVLRTSRGHNDNGVRHTRRVDDT